ncbi:hypothetical protein ACE1TI_16385, partial [Alteribacillus sp. JSM 102045]
TRGRMSPFGGFSGSSLLSWTRRTRGAQKGATPLLREKQRLKTPRERFTPEEAEALPAESEVYFNCGCIQQQSM